MTEPLFYVAFGLNSDGDARSYFLSENKKKVEDWVGNGGKRPIQPETTSKEAASPEESDENKAKELSAEVTSFAVITKNFLGSINKLNQVIPKTIMLLPLAEKMELNRRFYRPLSKVTKQVAKSEGFEIYEGGLEHMRLLERARQDLKALRNGRTSLPGMFLMGLISAYDAFLADLLKLIFLTQPELLSSSERNISFKDLVELGSVEAARNQIIEKEIETTLRQSHHSQFDSLESRLKIPLRKDLSIWPKFVEICERRNLFTHTNGVVSRQYLQVCEEHKCDLNNVAVGDQLKISPKYLGKSLDVVSELGWKLIQVVWRKLKPKEINDAANSLNFEAFELLCRGDFRLARTMLEFGLGFPKQGEEITRKMMVVNLAIAVKSLEDLDRAKKILDAEDWSAASDKFRIAIAAVREDIVSVVTLLGTIAEIEVDKSDFREWPAFRWVRDNPKFVSAFETRFNEAFLLDRGSADPADLPTLEEQSVKSLDEKTTPFGENSGAAITASDTDKIDQAP